MRVRYEATGETFTANDANDLVRKLHQTTFSQADNDAEYMQQAAERIRIAYGAVVRTDTAWHFYADLVKAKVLRPI